MLDVEVGVDVVKTEILITRISRFCVARRSRKDRVELKGRRAEFTEDFKPQMFVDLFIKS